VISVLAWKFVFSGGKFFTPGVMEMEIWAHFASCRVSLYINLNEAMID
jgi:hypothetical protein